MRYWFPYFFSAEEPLKERLDICPADFTLENGVFRELPLATFFSTIAIQYQTIVFNNFDFSKQTCFFEILENYTENVLFHGAIFTYEQLQMLLEKQVDLSKCTYFVKDKLSFEQYNELFYLAYPENTASLKKLKIDLIEKDLSQFPENFLGYCEIEAIKNLILTEAQLDFLMQKNPYAQKINFSGIELAGINISNYIKAHNERLCFLSEKCSNGVIIDVEALAICALDKKYHPCFNQTGFTFTLYFEEKLIPNLSVEWLFKKLENTKSSKTPRFQSSLSFFDQLEQLLKQDQNAQLPSFSSLSPGEKLLWVFYVAHHHEKTDIGKAIWLALGINKKYGFVSEPSAITLQPW